MLLRKRAELVCLALSQYATKRLRLITGAGSKSQGETACGTTRNSLRSHSNVIFMRWPQRNVVKLQFAVQSSAANSQHSSCQRFVAACLFENAQDCNALEVG